MGRLMQSDFDTSCSDFETKPYPHRLYIKSSLQSACSGLSLSLPWSHLTPLHVTSSIYHVMFMLVTRYNMLRINSLLYSITLLNRTIKAVNSFSSNVLDKACLNLYGIGEWTINILHYMQLQTAMQTAESFAHFIAFPIFQYL